MFEYEDEIYRFISVLDKFIDNYELPNEWFVAPDHLAIKCADALDYAFRIEELIPDASQTSEIVLDKRRLAALKLVSPIDLGNNRQLLWLEVMEPRPEKLGKSLIGLEHIEFIFPDFEKVIELLNNRKIKFTLQQNLGHAWINIVINQSGQELKLNDRLLSDIVAEEIAKGISRVL